MSKKPYTTPVLKQIDKLDYQKRTQHGDPTPDPDPNALTADDLAGKPTVRATKTGPIAHTQQCGLCRGPVRVGEACPECAPSVRPEQVMGRNSTDSTLIRPSGTVMNDERLPWMRAHR